jgi:molecular chaperone GrpE
MPEYTIDDRDGKIPAARDENERKAEADISEIETRMEAEIEAGMEKEAEEIDEMESLKNQLAAARADLYNYRQRAERDRAKIRKLVAEDKAAEFLPVLDNLDRALRVPEEGTAKDVLVGVRMVQRQFLSVLENSGVTMISTEGKFDPLQHEAVETEFVDDPSQDGVILLELLRGYRTPDRILRPAQVRVGKWRSPQNEQ